MSNAVKRIFASLVLCVLIATGMVTSARAQEADSQTKDAPAGASEEAKPATGTATFFTPGNLIVAVSGCANETGTCTSNATPGASGSINGPAGGYGDDQGAPWTLFQYSVTGATSATYLNSLQLPQLQSGANLPISTDYGSLSEGTVQLSGDNRFLTMYGFGLNAATFNANYVDYCPGNSGTLASSCVPENGNPAMAQTGSLLGQSYTGNIPVPRVAALIDPYGNVNSSTVLYNIHNQNDARSAYSVNGSSIYVSGQGCKTWDPGDMLCDGNSTSPYDDTMGVYLSATGITNDSPTPITGPDNGPTNCTSLTTCTSSADTRMVQVYNGTVYVSQDTKPGSSTGGYNRSYIGTLGAAGSTAVFTCAGQGAGCPTGDGPYGPAIMTGLGNTGGTGKYSINESGSGNTSNGNGLNVSSTATTPINLAPQNFFFASPTVLYVADTGFPKNTSNGPDAVCTADGGKSSATVGDGGLQKWVLNPTFTAGVTSGSGNTTVTGPTTGTFTQGQVGLTITDSSGFIPAGTTITAVSAAGKSATISKAATGTNASDSVTVAGWSLAYTLYNGLNLVLNSDCNPNTPQGPGGNASTGLYGVTGVVTNGVATLYVTSYPNNDLINSYLYGITDTLSTLTMVSPGTAFTQLDVAPSDSVFRGVSMAPSLPNGSETITSTPSGLTFTTSGTGCAAGTYVTPFTLSWTPGNSCTLSVAATQTVSGGPVNPVSTTYSFVSWQDGTTNAASDIVTAPSTTGIYNIAFQTQPTVVFPTASEITYGQTLASSTLSGGSASVGVNGVAVQGNFAFTTPATVPPTGTSSQSVTFTPNDSTDYTSVTGTVSVTVNQAETTISTSPTASAINYGQALSSSSLTGGSAVSGTTPVQGGFTWTTPATVPPTGTSSQNVTFTPNDTTDYSSANGTANVTVNPATPTISVASVTPATESYGQDAAMTVSIVVSWSGSGSAPTGAVSIGSSSLVRRGNTKHSEASFNNPATCSAPSGNSMNCSATVSPDATDVSGTYTITANIAADANYNSASSAQTNNFTVSQDGSATVISATPNPADYGATVTISATVSAGAPGSGTPTGTVAITDASNGGAAVCTITLSSGVGSCTESTLLPGTHSLSGSYSGDSNFTNSTGSSSLTINTASTTTAVTSGTNPSAYGQSVTFTATISTENGLVKRNVKTRNGIHSLDVSGTVTWSSNTGCATSSVSGGVATCTTSSLAVGSGDTVTATYSGDSNHAGSNGLVVQTVNQDGSSTVISASPNPADYGATVTITAAVSAAVPGSGTPTGTVAITDASNGGAAVCTITLSGGAGNCTSSTLAEGSHSLSGSYSGDKNFASSTGATSLTINGGSTTTAVTSGTNPSAYGQSVTFTATISTENGLVKKGVKTLSVRAQDATGTVTWSSNTGCAASTVSGGVATCTTSSLAGGSDTVTATYSGDSNHTGSNGSVVQTVNKATPSLTINNANFSYGSTEAVAMSTTVTWTGSGSAPTASDIHIGFASSGTSIGGNVGATTCGSPSGNSMTCSANYTPSGTQAAGTYSSPSSMTLQASFAGDSNYAAASSSADTVTISAVAPTVSVTPDPVELTSGSTKAVPLAVTVTGAGSSNAAPTGAISLSAATGSFSTPSCSTSGDVITCTVNYTPSGTLASGIYSNYITASVAAAGNYTLASGSTSAVVSLVMPTVSVTSVSPASLVYDGGKTTKITATLSWTGSGPTPTAGTSSLLVFSTTAGGSFGAVTCTGSSSPITCTVTFTPSGIDAVGTYTIAANYAGNSYYNPAGSGQTNNFSITAAAATAALSPTTVDVAYGSTTPVALTATFTGTGSGEAAPSGAVSFSAATGSFSGTSCTTSGDVMSCSTNYTPSGTVAVGSTSKYITAAMTAAGDYSAASASATLKVAAAASSIANFACSPNAGTYGADITCSGNLMADGTGISGQSVTIKSGTTSEGTVTTGAGGAFSKSFAPPSGGVLTITASYAATTDYAATSTTYTETVNSATTTTALGCTSGSSACPSTFSTPTKISLTATVSSTAGTPTGTVTFYDGSTVIATKTLSDGSATYTYTPAKATHAYQATHTATTDFGASSSAVETITVN